MKELKNFSELDLDDKFLEIGEVYVHEGIRVVDVVRVTSNRDDTGGVPFIYEPLGVFKVPFAIAFWLAESNACAARFSHEQTKYQIRKNMGFNGEPEVHIGKDFYEDRSNMLKGIRRDSYGLNSI